VGQEFFINSEQLEDKIKNLLPSQGGLGAGFDLSASTQIVPIVDLTESAEGSNLRQDLQTAISFDSATAFSVANATTTVINNTGYFKVSGIIYGRALSGTNRTVTFQLTDGASTKDVFVVNWNANTGESFVQLFDFNVFISAGDSLTVISNDGFIVANGTTRQIANIDGELVNP
jgi:hypothetical protein